MTQYQKFKNKWLGKVIDYDGHYGGQCFDVANQWILEVGGVPPLITLLKASDIFRRPEGIIPSTVRYERITNTPEAVPQQGDIIVWDNALWNGNYGHVAIVESATKDSCVVLQQNGFNPNEGVRIVNWNFHTHNALGWLRILPNNQNNNYMDKDKLIQSINENTIFDDATKKHLIDAVHNNDAAYLLAFSGSEPRRELQELTVNSQQSTATNISTSLYNKTRENATYEVTKEQLEEIVTIADEAKKLVEQGKNEKWDFNKWVLGFAKFGVDKWAIFSSAISAVSYFVSTNLSDEQKMQLWYFCGAMSAIVLVYFLTNKLIDKWKK